MVAEHSDAASPEERAIAAQEAVRQQFGPDAWEPELPKVAAEGSSPCDGWFHAAILSFKAAESAKDNDTFQALFEEGQSYIAIGQACQETLKTL